MRRLCSILLACLVCLPLTSCAFGGSARHISALFRDSAGLFVGNDVGVLGVKVGSVTGIHPEGPVVRVDMNITDSSVKIPEGAAAVVVSRSVATDRYIELTPVYTGGPVMASGTVIPRDRTQTPVDFDEVLKSLSTISTDLIGSKATTNAIKRFLSAGAKAFGPNGALMNQTITQFGNALNEVSGKSASVTQTLGSLDTLTTALVKNKDTVQQFVNSVQGATQTLAAERGNLQQAMSLLNQTVNDVSRFTAVNGKKIRGTLVDVSAVADILLARRNQVAEFIDTMPLAAQNVARAKDPSGMRIRLPATTAIGGAALTQICGMIGGNLCSVTNVGLTGPIGTLLSGLGVLGAL